MVNRCGRGQQVRRNVESGGKLRRGQQVRTWSTGCGETWSQAGRLRRGQQVRRNVVSRCDETWGQQVRRDVVNRCGRGQVRRNVESGGQLRRGQQVRRDVVNRCRNAVSRCGKRGQPVRKTRSAGAENAVSRCGKRGQQVRGTRSTGAAKHCFRQCSQGFANPTRSSRSPRSFPERGEGREPVAACFAADAARRHRILLHTGLLIVEPQPSIDDRGRRGALPPITSQPVRSTTSAECFRVDLVRRDCSDRGQGSAPPIASTALR